MSKLHKLINDVRSRPFTYFLFSLQLVLAVYLMTGILRLDSLLNQHGCRVMVETSGVIPK